MNPLGLHDPIPKSCKVRDVCRALNISRDTFYRAMAAGKLSLVELAPMGRSRRFSGESVERAAARTRWAVVKRQVSA
jgi:excisionase family DNA binding protein